MRLPSFMKINTHKRFEFKPRYYDERKERLDKIKAKYNGENDSPEAVKERIRGEYQRRFSDKKAMNFNRSSSIRFILIFFGLVAIAYFLLR